MKVVKPIVTEKAYALSAQNIYTFRADEEMKKSEIATVVEKQYGVKVEVVRTVMMASRTKRVGKTRVEVRLPKWKKAYVTLAKGEKLDVFEQKEQKTVVSEVKE